MKKSITIFTLTHADVVVPFATKKQAEDTQEVLAKFNVEVELKKDKKVIEL